MSLLADFPAELDAARSWTFEACRVNDGCWGFEVPSDAEIQTNYGTDTLVADLVTLGESTRVKVAVSLARERGGRPYIAVGWDIPEKPGTGDRYWLEAREPDGTQHQLLDEPVFYTNMTRVIGQYCGTSRFGAVVDTRE